MEPVLVCAGKVSDLNSEQVEAIKNIGRNISVLETDKTSSWISVKESLPEKRERVLCFYKFEPDSPNVICENTYLGGGMWMSETDKVTHWMPLPEPPETE